MRRLLCAKQLNWRKPGDRPMLKLLLDRIVPKERSVLVDLRPMDRASDAVDVLGTIIDAGGTGRISPSEGSALASLVDAYARSINVADLELRLYKRSDNGRLG